MIPSTNKQILVSEDWKKIYQSFRNADFKSYDFETLRRTMIQYLRENYPEEFNDYIDSSEYIALIDVIAYLGQNLSFRIDLNARENFLETAQRRESILRLAQLVSYNPARNVASSGFLKITAVATSDNVFDSNGTNLANSTIGWNDPTNSNWYQQFINIMNSAMITNFGNPVNKDVISGVNTEEYAVNSVNADTPIFSFSKNINGTQMSFEVVPCTFSNKTYVYEKTPEPASLFSFIYKNDNQGAASSNSGFFTHFKQGKLSVSQFSVDNPVPNEIVGVNTPDINNDDIWLWQVDKNGNYSTTWTPVPSLLGNNVIYNSLSRNLRTIYGVTTRDADQIDLNFADGVFGDLPKGEFRLFYRQSNGLTYIIKPEQLSSVVISIPYTNANGQRHSLQLTMSLQYTVTNSSGPESNASIQLKAPQTYYTQNRMITGEDYNIAPLTAGTDILKVKSVNRVSSGLSRYFDISDVSGRYSNTNIYANDGLLYKNLVEQNFNFAFANRSTVVSMITNKLSPIVASPAMKSFYYSNFSNPSLSELELKWVEVTTNVGQSTGYFLDSSNAVEAVGIYSQANLKYVSPGSLIKFIAPSGKYFDVNHVLQSIPASNLLPVGAKTYYWAAVTKVTGDGGNSGIGALNNGTGPIVLGIRIPSNAIPVEVLPQYNNTLGYPIENEIANICMSQTNFGLTINSNTRKWSIILNSNLDLVNSFDITTQDNITNSGRDASWLIAFVWTGSQYTIRYRLLNYVFESESDTSFFVNDSTINYDFINNTVVKDKIEILSVNLEPTNIGGVQWFSGAPIPTAATGINGSFYIRTTNNTLFKKVSGVWTVASNLSGQIGEDLTWQIDSSVIENDGYVNPNKINVSFYNYNNTNQIDNPSMFTDIVGTGNYIFFKKSSNGLNYTLTTDVDHILETESDWNSYKFTRSTSNPPQPVQDGDLVYFYSANEDVVKQYATLTDSLTYTDEYYAKEGRSGLKFHYVHNSGDDTRVDPSKSNIIDISVLTVSYDAAFRSWLSGNTTSMPLPPTSESLSQNYQSKLEPIKAISDEIIFHPVKYKVLFGDQASPNLQAVFKAVRNPTQITTDNDIKSRILAAIGEFFALENWEFGQSFYFSELSTYVMNNLTPDITNFVIVPKLSNGFGSLYQLSCLPDELFVSGTSISDIEVIDSITAAQLNASGIITTSGT